MSKMHFYKKPEDALRWQNSVPETNDLVQRPDVHLAPAKNALVRPTSNTVLTQTHL